ncbi:DUF2537 domain-containing protein [Actinokineospora guangxiensis]|uniref:DUF2537 domain-containing protein n=1 Tax=Actinokineospora guangxiensis TaxID=1490288 RepID=A0ABW0EM34_9PSEU
MELRASDERPVLVTENGDIDPDTLPLDPALTEDLNEWARVATAVSRAADPTAAPVVSRRGRQLALRLADATTTPITYVDPLTGEASVVNPTSPLLVADAEPEQTPDPTEPTEPTPWGTGLLVAAFAFTLVVFAIGTLAATLNENSPLLAIGANVVVTGGLLPSVWLARGVPIWRWVAFGVGAGIAAGWVALPFVIFS